MQVKTRKRKLTKKQRKGTLKKETKSLALPSGWSLLKESLKHLYKNKKILSGILIVYGVLSLLFVTGIGGAFRLGFFQETLNETFGDMSKLGSGLALFGLLVNSLGESNGESASVYQTLIILITSLAIIWVLRNSYKESGRLSLRRSFYEGVAPIVPFTLVSMVILIELIPFLFAASLYSAVKSNALLSSGSEDFFWLMVLFAGALVTAMLLSISVFALYIVTLQGSTPFSALRSSFKITRFRRLLIMRRILFLPVILLILSALVLVPLIIILPKVAEVIFLIFSVSLIAVFHSYLYRLYRELI